MFFLFVRGDPGTASARGNLRTCAFPPLQYSFNNRCKRFLAAATEPLPRCSTRNREHSTMALEASVKKQIINMLYAVRFLLAAG